MKVQVGTDTQQNDGAEHVVDQVAKLGLQIALPIPKYLKERDLFGQELHRNFYLSLVPFKEWQVLTYQNQH